MTLTKEQRIEVLEEVYKMIETGEETWICAGVDITLRKRYDIEFATFSDTFKYFPELLQFKPAGKCKGDAWFRYGMRKPRLEILRKTINIIKEQK